MNVVVELGTANLGSLAGALGFIGAEFVVTDDPAIVGRASRLLLPGVGSFDAGMDELEGRGLVDPIRAAVRDRGAPVLGICLGMQLLLESSEEGRADGLGLLPGRAVRLGSGGAKVPHVGFDPAALPPGGVLGAGLPAAPAFYFTHSFCLRTAGPDVLVGACDYDGSFLAAIEAGPVMGVQFHPEKSQTAGLRVLVNFLRDSEPAR